jgi:rubrerythrin
MDNILKNNEKDPKQVQNEDSIANQKLGYDLNQAPPEDLDARWLRWKCMVCGYVYEGAVPLKVCPKCGNDDPDKFEEVD